MDTAIKVHKLCFPDCGAQYNKTDYYIYFPNGSEIWFSGLDSAERTEKILGKEYSTIFFNECSQLSMASVNMAKTRLAEKNGLRKFLLYDQNPGNKTHWAYWLWEKHFDPVSEESVEPDDYVSILMNPMDNLDNIDPDYIAMIEKLPQKERDRFLMGLYTDSDDGQVYYEFSRERHVDATVKQRHGTIFINMDFNVDPMTATLMQVVNNELHVFDEVFLRNSDTPKMCRTLKDMGHSGGKIIPDSTGRNRKTSGKSDFVILKEAGFSIESTHNPYVVDRVNNLNRLLAADRIKINPKCKKLINDLEQVAWKDNKLDQKGESKLLTHISDGLGYGCWKIEPMAAKMKKAESYYR